MRPVQRFWGILEIFTCRTCLSLWTLNVTPIVVIYLFIFHNKCLEGVSIYN